MEEDARRSVERRRRRRGIDNQRTKNKEGSWLQDLKTIKNETTNNL